MDVVRYYFFLEKEEVPCRQIVTPQGEKSEWVKRLVYSLVVGEVIFTSTSYFKKIEIRKKGN